jgi:hypothetical protein
MSTTQTLEGLVSGAYSGTNRLKISDNLTTFPLEILDLSQTLETLDLSNNPLSSLPPTFSRLHKLKILFLSNCNFTTFPSQLARCRSLEMIAFKGNHMISIPPNSFPRKLRWLILTNNEIAELPAGMGDCHMLQKCMLAGNKLTSLPDEMAACRKLGLLRLSANNLTSLPPWLFNLPELSFLSFAGNPCTTALAPSSSLLPIIPWTALEVKHLLGEGASGVISAGSWTPASPPEAQTIDVAIKLFKGECTSDGRPADEMDACIAAGSHPNLIDPIASIASHPASSQGLVLELIPPTYKNLGLPPTLQSCTRDAFPLKAVYSISQILGILKGIASASQHLHERGIAHGDLYAHNILIDKSGHALLGDFGAATVYGKEFAHEENIHKMEILAYGHLIEDMLSLVENKVGTVMDEKHMIVIETLNSLHYRCSNPSVIERPSFGEVYETLAGI